MPIKFAIHYDELPKKYIIAELQYSTAALWKIIGDETGYYSEPIDAFLYGNIPSVSYDIQISDNKFICVAEYQGNKIMNSGYENAIYHISDWDILYPIRRDKLLFLPKSYLCKFDLHNKN